MMCTEVAIVSLLEHRRNGMKFEPILFQIEGAQPVRLVLKPADKPAEVDLL